jgi:aryl-alcohol dehydrogenase-like predicted oxidoreductase
MRLWSRRDLLSPVSGVFLGSLCFESRSEDNPATLMAKKQIPSTGQSIPVVGLGTAINTNKARPKSANLESALDRFLAFGGSLIDTAFAYGEEIGDSTEARIGAYLKASGARPRCFLATKFYVYNEDITTSKQTIERSFARLATSSIDLLQAYTLESVEVLRDYLEAMRADGRVRYIGVSMLNQPYPFERFRRLVEVGTIDFVQVAYSIETRDVTEQLLPYAWDHGLGVIAANTFGGTSSLFPVVSGRTLPPWAAEVGIRSWAQFFLKYVVSHPAITCAIPGSIQPAHVEDNMAAGFMPLLEPFTLRRMETFWKTLTRT